MIQSTNYININAHYVTLFIAILNLLHYKTDLMLKYRIDHSELHFMIVNHYDTPLINIYLQFLTCVML
jgi:hypothetical protein